MGIRSGLGDVVSGVKSAWNNTVDQIGASMNAIFDAAATQLGSIWSGGFIGVNKDSWPEIKTAVEKLITDAETEINRFNEAASTDEAIKGQAAEKLGEYLAACKKLLSAYVSTYRNFITDAETALEAMYAGDEANAKNISEATTNVENMANEIQVN